MLGRNKFALKAWWIEFFLFSTNLVSDWISVSRFLQLRRIQKKSVFCFWNFPSLTREKNICLTYSCLFDLGIGHFYHLHLASTQRCSACTIISIAAKAFGLLLITVYDRRHLKGLFSWRGHKVKGLVKGSCCATTLGLKRLLGLATIYFEKICIIYLKVRLTQNEFMKSSILQNSNWKIWRISALKVFKD